MTTAAFSVPVLESAPACAPAAGAGEVSACLVLAGGGTGGHVMPGVALAQKWRRRHPGAQIRLFMPGQGFRDDALLARHGIGVEGIPMVKVPRRKIEWPVFGGRFFGCFLAARNRLKEFRPGLAVGLGGYGSVPVVLAARWLGIPVLLVEQNAVPGRANRFLAPFAREVACQFDEAVPFFRRGRGYGAPLREEIFADRRRDPAGLGLSHGLKTVLVVGGSQGASGLNALVLRMLPAIADLKDAVQFIHLTGPRDLLDAAAAYRSCGFAAHAAAFDPDIFPLFRLADLVLARAGGNTLGEITLLGRPAILVPYPHAADDHQRMNARALERRGAAAVFEEGGDPAELGRQVRRLLTTPRALAAMASASLREGRPLSTGRLVSRMDALRAGGSTAPKSFVNP